MTPGRLSAPLTSSLCAVLVAAPGAEQAARHYVIDVLRTVIDVSQTTRVSGTLIDIAAHLARQAVEAVLAAAPGPTLDLTVEVGAETVLVTVTAHGHGLFDAATAERLERELPPARPAVAWGVRQQPNQTSLWFSIDGIDGIDELIRPADEQSQPRFQVLRQIAGALAAANSLTAISDAVTGAVRAHLGAAFTGIAVPDPLALGHLRYISMDPLPEQTARDWTEIPISDASPLGVAMAQALPTFLGSRSAAEQAFAGIAEHMRIAGVSSMAHVPLSWSGQSIGVLAVSWAEEHVIDVEEQALIAAVASYTALAAHRTNGAVLAAAKASPVEAGTTEPGSSSTVAPATVLGAVRPLRVLLVDDTADIRELLAALFARRSDVHVVAAARNGQEAIELASALQPDIVVLDVAMPVMDGITALPRLTAAAPHARIVMLSALPAGLRAPIALASGATAYIEKSTAVATLVDDLLEGAKLLDVAVRHLTEQADRQLDADLQQVQLARHFVADTLQSWEQSPLADTIVLLLSELVTNAIVHARSAPRVSVRLLPDRVHVEVTDQDPNVAHARAFTDEGTSGRGLAIIESLAMGWGTALLPHGKVVWFDVAREPV